MLLLTWGNLAVFWKPMLRCLSRPGVRAKLQVFIFHRVLAEPDLLLGGEPTAADFEWMVRFISGAYNVLPFGEAVARLQRGTLPAAPACITFDDGYRDNVTIALPILKKYRVPATFFIATAFLSGTRMWNDDVIEAVRAAPDGELDWSVFGLGRHDLDSTAQRSRCIENVLNKLKYVQHTERWQLARELARRAELPTISSLMMERDHVTALAQAGMEIGAHTHSHPILSGLSESQAESEIAQGKSELEAILGKPVESFAYPNGSIKRDLTENHVHMLGRLGFHAAAITDRGVANSHTNPFLIPRFTPWDKTPMKFALRCSLSLADNGRGIAHAEY